MNMQNVSNLVIPDGEVRTIHDKNSKLLWSKVNYATKYAGDVFQQTYSGKNLCDSFAATKASWQSGNLTVGSDGSIIVSNNPGSNNYFALGQTLGDLCPSLAVGDVAYLRLLTNSVASGRIYIGENWFDGYSKIITQNMLDASVVIYGGYGQTDNIKIMITKDSLSQTYEQYVGGTASPNPQFPQQIQVVTGTQTISITDGANTQNFTVNLGSTELAKIGTYQDYIYKSGDDWYVHKETAKIIFNGTEEWQYVSGAHTRFTLNKSDLAFGENAEGSQPVAFSTQFKGSDILTIYNNKIDNAIAGHNSVHQFWVKADSFADATALETWFTTHNAITYYALATPTDTKITDTTLISELEAIHEWLTRYGYYDTVSGNLPIVIDRTNL